MKKLFFLTALLCASVMSWASTKYCGETSPNANFTFSLTHVSGNTYKIQFDAVGDDHFSGTVNNINCGVNQTAGAGIFFGGDNTKNWVITADRAYLEFETASESSVPTGFYANFFAFAKAEGGEILITDFNPADVDWTATCGAAVKENPNLTITAQPEDSLNADISETFTITASRLGDGAITFESSKPGIASVNETTGVITAIGLGSTTITVRVAETDTYAAASKKITVNVKGAINWPGVDWLTNSEQYKLVVIPNIEDRFGGKKIEGENLWVGFPSAVFGECSIEYSALGAGVSFALSNFPQKTKNQFTMVCEGITYTFYVYNDNGTDSATAIDNVEVGAKAIKMFENGQLVIIKNGVKYNALGAELR